MTIKKFLYKKEIKLSSKQSLLCILGIVVTIVLSFALGYMLGSPDKSSENEVASRYTEGYSRKQSNLPINDKKNLIKESELTFYDTLVSDDKVSYKKVTEKKKIPQTKKTVEAKSQKALKNQNSKKAVKQQEKVIEQKKKIEEVKEEPVLAYISPENFDNKTSQPTKQKVVLYTLQIGSFKSINDANHLKGRLERRGYEPYVMQFNKEGVTWYRVRVGVLKGKMNADAFAKKIHTEENITSYVARYEPY